MSEQTENYQSPSLSLDEQKFNEEIKLREAEVAFKREQLAAEVQGASNAWSPAVTTLLIAVIGGVGSIAAALFQASKERELERMKHESALIIKVLEVGDLEKAKKNLKFLVDTGLIRDETQRIADAVERGEVPFFAPSDALPDLSSIKIPEERFYALGDAAKRYFEKDKIDEAKKYAEEQSSLMPQFKDNWNYGNAVQDVNLVLGRIAVKQGRIDDARRYLLLAGNTPGSPQLDTFGPNMSLALDLFKIDERKVVIEYFELCRKFWELEDGKLDKWKSDVQEGRTPDFGANLVY